MRAPGDFASGKGHHDENFPVASFLIHPRHRGIILDFYRFARAADDVADDPTADPTEKLHVLEAMRASLAGEDDAVEVSVTLRTSLARSNLTNQHPLDLLEAFRRDVSKLRYENWDEVMDYCRYSAMPVGRFVLDVHGEDRAIWPKSDALCAALQVINHLQDCGKDFRSLNRVYLPLDFLGRAGAVPEELGRNVASEAVLTAIHELAQMTAALLAEARPFSDLIADGRLALEVSVIQALAEDLNLRLLERDPLSERVHHRKSEVLGVAARATAGFVGRRVRSKTRPRSFARQP
jgi:squalene synthase HpnC